MTPHRPATVTTEIERRWESWFGTQSPGLEWVLQSTARIEAQTSVVLYAIESGRSEPAVVAKVSRDPRFGSVIRSEFETLREVAALLTGETGDTVPVALDLIVVEPDLYLVSTYAESDIDWEHAEHRWREHTLDQLAGWLAELHTRSQRRKGPSVDADDRPIATFVEVFVPDKEVTRALAVADEMVMTEFEESETEILVHGDFWSGNWRFAGGGFKVIDWEHAHRSPSPLLDEFLLPLSLRVTTHHAESMALGTLSDRYRAHRGLQPRGREEMRLASIWCAAEVATRPYRRWGKVEDWSLRWCDLVERLATGT